MREQLECKVHKLGPDCRTFTLSPFIRQFAAVIRAKSLEIKTFRDLETREIYLEIRLLKDGDHGK